MLGCSVGFLCVACLPPSPCAPTYELSFFPHFHLPGLVVSEWELESCSFGEVLALYTLEQDLEPRLGPPLIGASFAHACVCVCVCGWLDGWVTSLKSQVCQLGWVGLGWVYGGSRRLDSVLHDVCFPLDLDLCQRFPLHFVKDPCECGWAGGLVC